MGVGSLWRLVVGVLRRRGVSKTRRGHPAGAAITRAADGRPPPDASASNHWPERVGLGLHTGLTNFGREAQRAIALLGIVHTRLRPLRPTSCPFEVVGDDPPCRP